jgi:hypothetical protein
LVSQLREDLLLCSSYLPLGVPNGLLLISHRRDGVVMVEMKVLVMMMILMKSSAMVMTMATISPLWEGISPANSCLLESFSLSVFSTPQRRRCLSLIPLDLGFQGQ